MWDPEVYLGFADHRARPFYDLLVRVAATDPRRVVDLGCGPGTSPVSWPAAGRAPSSRRSIARRRWWPPPAVAGWTRRSAT